MPALAVGIEIDGTKVHNQAILIEPDGSMTQKKTQSHPSPESGFSPGRDIPCLDLEGAKGAVLLEEDILYPELARLPVLSGAQFLIHLAEPSDSTAATGVPALFAARALENEVPLIHLSPALLSVIGADGETLHAVAGSELADRLLEVIEIPLSPAPSDRVRRSAEHPTLAAFWNEGIRAFEQENRPPPPEDANVIRIAAISFVPEKWGKDANMAKCEETIRRAASTEGVDLVVTPEGILEGYVVNEVDRVTGEEKIRLEREFLEIAEPIDGPYIQGFRNLAQEFSVLLCVGFAERRGAEVYNTVALIGRDGEIIGQYDKTHLAQGYGHPTFYKTGVKFPSYPTEQGRIGMIICYDRQLPEPARYVRLSGAQIILAPSYGSTGEWNDQVIRMRARENGVPMVFCHPIQALFVDAAGEVLKNVYATDHIEICDVPLPSKDTDRITLRRPDLYPLGDPTRQP
jgi:predicted amidohydrolase